MVSIRIFDHQKVDQGHELQRHGIRCRIFCGIQDGEKIG